jgi:hypothetical protein
VGQRRNQQRFVAEFIANPVLTFGQIRQLIIRRTRAPSGLRHKEMGSKEENLRTARNCPLVNVTLALQSVFVNPTIAVGSPNQPRHLH